METKFEAGKLTSQKTVSGLKLLIENYLKILQQLKPGDSNLISELSNLSMQLIENFNQNLTSKNVKDRIEAYWFVFFC